MPYAINKLHLTVVLMYFVALLWLAFGLAWLFRDSAYNTFYFVTGLAAAIILSLLAYFLKQKRAWAWWLAVTFAAFEVMTVVFDQVGWFDLIYLIPAIVLLGLIISIKKEFQKSSPPSQ